MGKVLVKDLVPDTNYVLQVRSVNNNGPGPWSSAVPFTTTKDQLAPAAVNNLVWQVSGTDGTAFHASWTPPTSNNDLALTTLKDLSGYRVVLTANFISKTYDITATNFDLTFERNVALWGTPQPTVSITVYAIDQSGNISPGSTASVTNPPPVTPTNVVTAGMVGAIQVNWDVNPDKDLKYYEVHVGTTSGFTTSAATRVWRGLGTTAIFKTTTYTQQWVKVVAVDVFNQSTASAGVSVTAINPGVPDTTPPASVTTATVAPNTVVAGDTTYSAKVTWTITTPDSDGAGFKILYRATDDSGSWNYLDVPDYTARTVDVRGLRFGKSYNFQVQVYDYTGNLSGVVQATPYPLPAVNDTSPPSTPSAPTGVGTTGYQKIQVTHSLTKAAGGALEDDLAYLEVYYSTTSTVTYDNAHYLGNIACPLPSLFVTNGGKVNGTFTVPVARSSDADTSTNKTFYVGVIAVDNAGNRSPGSAASSVTVGLIDNLAAAYASITDAVIQNLSVSKLVAGSGTANDFTIYSTLTVGNTGGINNLPGVIKSADYLPGLTGFKLQSGSLEINTGDIYAQSLHLQNGFNIMPLGMADFEFVRSYYVGSGATLGIYVDVNAGPPGVGPKFGTQCLEVVSPLNAPTINVDLTLISANPYNIDVEPSTPYIVSFYAYGNDTVNNTITVSLKWQDGTTSSFTPSIAPGGWTRYSSVITSPSNASKARMLLYGIKNPPGMYFDGIQIEKQLTKDTTPSVWKPPSATSIDGGTIRTGQIISSNYVANTAGWAINLAGSAEFNDITVRGNVYSSNIEGSSFATTSDTSAARVILDSLSFYGPGAGTVMFWGDVIGNKIPQTSGTGGFARIYGYSIGGNIKYSTSLQLRTGNDPDQTNSFYSYIDMAYNDIEIRSGGNLNLHVDVGNYIWVTGDNTFTLNPTATRNGSPGILNATNIHLMTGGTDVYLENAAGTLVNIKCSTVNGSSSMIHKTDISNSDLKALDVLKKLNVIKFRRTDFGDSSRIEHGFSAEEVQKIYPDAVVDLDTDGHVPRTDGKPHGLAIDFMAMIAMNTKAIQELSERIEKLQKG